MDWHFNGADFLFFKKAAPLKRKLDTVRYTNPSAKQTQLTQLEVEDIKHVGDITKLNGYDLPTVDCIFGGSPCQDLSVAGRRAGMKHGDKGDDETTRSGLFIDQMRIIKEMREHDRATGRSGRFLRPRFMVWENVPGALTSPGRGHAGEDFAAVIEEVIKVAEPGASVSVCVPNGGWPKAGCYYAEDGSWSLAWRVHDAQFWGTSQYVDGRMLFPGTPQRRRRIALVADFGGLSAPEVLFERKGLSWDSDESGEEREEASGRAGGGASEAGGSHAISFQERAGKPGGGKGILIQDEHTGALSTLNIQSVYAEPTMIEMTSTKNTIIEDGTSCTLTARMGTGGNQVNAVFSGGIGINGDVAGTLDSHYYKGCGTREGIEREVVLPFDTTQITSPGNYSQPKPGDPCHPLAAGAHPPAIAFKQGNGPKARGVGAQEEVSPALVSSSSGTNMVPAVCFGIDQQGGKGGANYTVDISPPILSDSHGTPHAVAVGNGQLHNISMSEVSNCLDAMHDPQAVMVPDVSHALKAKHNCDYREDSETYVATAIRNTVRSMVRRLTPTECCRLQGLPDGYADIGEWFDDKGKKHKDSDTNKYKAFGNSMCRPFWFWLIRRISALYERPATLGSLFDGLGVAPLCWEQCNGKGTAVWASEIDPFCIAVTKRHFPEDEDGSTEN